MYFRCISWLVVLKTEGHYVLKTNLPKENDKNVKRYCKNVDITEREFISNAVRDCIKKKLSRKDTIELFCQYSGLPYNAIHRIVKCDYSNGYIDGIIETVIDGIRQEIIYRSYVVKSIHYQTKIDGNSGKVRQIGIQDVKQQLYDYIAAYGLWELFTVKIGYYQCSALENKGQIFGVKALKKWVDDHHIRYAIQSDIRHFYDTIDINVLKDMLRRDVKNELLLHLTFFLIDTFNKGLAIGSYLSQLLACYYLSLAYHYVTEQCYRIRKHKDGTQSRVNLVEHALWFADDCVLLGSNLKDLKKAHKLYAQFCEGKLHVEVKPEVKVIDLQTGYIDMMGYKVSRKNVTIRSSDFIRLRRNQKRVESYSDDYIPLHEARGFSSRSGALMHSDSKHYCKRTGALETKQKCNEIISRKARRKVA